MKKNIALYTLLLYTCTTGAAEERHSAENLSTAEAISFIESIMYGTAVPFDQAFIIPDYDDQTVQLTIGLPEVKNALKDIAGIIDHINNNQARFPDKLIMASKLFPEYKRILEEEAATPLIPSSADVSRQLRHLEYIQNDEYALWGAIKSLIGFFDGKDLSIAPNNYQAKENVKAKPDAEAEYSSAGKARKKLQHTLLGQNAASNILEEELYNGIIPINRPDGYQKKRRLTVAVLETIERVCAIPHKPGHDDEKIIDRDIKKALAFSKEMTCHCLPAIGSRETSELKELMMPAQ